MSGDAMRLLLHIKLGVFKQHAESCVSLISDLCVKLMNRQGQSDNEIRRIILKCVISLSAGKNLISLTETFFPVFFRILLVTSPVLVTFFLNRA